MNTSERIDLSEKRSPGCGIDVTTVITRVELVWSLSLIKRVGTVAVVDRPSSKERCGGPQLREVHGADEGPDRAWTTC